MIHHVALEVRREDAGELERLWPLLGFARVDVPPTLAGRAIWFERAGTQVHLVLYDEPVAPPEGHVAVVAPDYEATLERVRAAGYEVRPGHPHWGAPRSFVHPPGGHRVEVMSRPPDAAA